MSNILEVSNLRKVYGGPLSAKVEALKNVSFTVEKGEFIAIMGESGSGKTTLLNILATLDQPTQGQVLLNGRDLAGINQKEIAAFRRNELGFVFQEFNLLDRFSIKDNILLPLVLSNVPASTMKERVQEVAQELGIRELLERFPHEVSGGQKQRAAIARALITAPSLLLSDEPTGALDSNSSEKTMRIFEDIHKKGQTILMVTHSVRCASYASRVLFIKDGQLFHEIYKGSNSSEDFLERINESQSLIYRREVSNER